MPRKYKSKNIYYKHTKPKRSRCFFDSVKNDYRVRLIYMTKRGEEKTVKGYLDTIEFVGKKLKLFLIRRVNPLTYFSIDLENVLEVTLTNIKPMKIIKVV